MSTEEGNCMRYRLARQVSTLLVLCTLLAGWLSGCGGGDGSESPAPSGSTPVTQTLALSMNPRAVPPPTEQDFLTAIDLALGAGVRGVTLTYPWSALEPQPQRYTLDELRDAIAFFTARRVDIYLGIQVINTVRRETPSDLLTVPFDAPQMRARFRALLDRVQPFVTARVKYLAIGNEVNVYLEAHPTEWTPYQTLYEDGLAYAHQRLPGLLVGAVATYAGAIGSSQAQLIRLNTQSDVVMYTYYPLRGDFQVQEPQAPLADFPTMLSLAGGKPVVLQEVGFPSDPLNGSSEALAAAFVSNALTAWRAAGAGMPFLGYFLEHDLDNDTCELLQSYYALPSRTFKAYLCSLGLRRMDGSPKPSWDRFVAGARTPAP